ncbi:MAG TPA: AMP-binding protein, partial [Kofleriaceae bacterium]|nr:AMP-binding protein [Kofleriaceae bacterium]
MSVHRDPTTGLTHLLAQLDASGVVLSLKGDDLAVKGNDKALADRALIAALRAHKPELVELLRSGHAIGGGAAVVAPPNRIPPGATRITPDMLTMVELDPGAIDAIVATVDGGAANLQDIYPLAPLQDGMLFHHLLRPDRDVYTEGYLLGFPSRAKLERFVAALQQVIDRHDILRTGIVWDGLAQPVQVVRRSATLPVEFVALDPADGDIADQLEARYDAGRYRFDLARPPLIACVAAEDRTRGRWLLRVLVHHIAIDHAALEQLVDEAQRIERGEAAQLPAPVPFRAFIAQARLGTSGAEHEAFFTRMLGDIDEPTAPFGLLDVQGDGRGIAEASLVLAPRLARAIRQQARALGVTAASVFHLAWAMVLARTTGRREVVFGTVLFGRMHGADADRMLGLLMNTLPIRVSVGGLGAAASAKHVHGVLAELLRHEHASLALAQRCSAVPARAPLFTSLLNYRYNVAAAADRARGDHDIELIGGRERTNYPLALSVDDLGHGFELTAQVADGVAPERICALVQTALDQLIAALDQAPGRPLDQLDVLPAEDRAQLAAWNATARPFPPGQCVHQLVEAQVARTPHAIAVIDGERQLHYDELDARANQLAAQLRALGTGPDVPVGLCLERSAEMVIGLLAVLKAGGCYVPLDPDYPIDRVREMVDDAAPAVVLVDDAGERVMAQIDDRGAPVRLHVVTDAARWAALPAQEDPRDATRGAVNGPALPVQSGRESPLAEDPRDATRGGVNGPALPVQSGRESPLSIDRHLAYVIYTSGSTGRPKGVMNEHRGVVNRLRWMQHAY